MEDRKVAWAIAAAVAVVLGLLLFSERVQRELAPDPVAALVAVEVAGSGVARLGLAEVDVGTEFTLHAVLEAKKRSGESVYFSEAPALEIGGETVDPGALRPWEGPDQARILWFSVEGPRPVVELDGNQGLEAVRFQEVYRSDWARGWSIPGSLKPARANWTEEVKALRGAPFGTQRFQVRVELFGSTSQLVPIATFDSSGADEVITLGDRFSGVVAALPGALELPSRVFGLTQVRWGASPPAPAMAALQAWFDLDLAFSRVLLLRRMVDRHGRPWEDLVWDPVDLAAGPAWQAGSIAAGDLLRAGERVVVLYEDRGDPGRVDLGDLCLDFEDGAEVRRLGEIFSGEGLVEHTALEQTRTTGG